MITSAAGREFIQRQEGCCLHVYSDQLGYPTIGYGHRVRAPSLAAALALYPSGLTQAGAMELLIDDLRVAEAGVRQNVHVELPQGIFDALVDLCHNCGPACLVGTKCLAALNAGDFQTARSEFLGFVHGTDARTGARTVLPVLVARRQAAAEHLWDPSAASGDAT